jgi:hypothetical protein
MRNFDLRRYAPVIVIVLLVAGPLAIWAATSGGSGGGTKKTGLIVERGVSFTGAPELVVSINGEAEVTTGADTVRIECTDKDGNVIIKTSQPWPFIDEPGYPYPHVHLGDSPEKVEGSRHCRVIGTDKRLEAAVQ